MSRTKHILVIGGGVVGLCSAYYSALRGHRVTLVERGQPQHDCCSIGNAGLVCPSHFIPLAAPGMVGTALRMMLDPESPFYVRPRLDWDLLDWGWKFHRAANARQVDLAAPILKELNYQSRDLFDELAQSSNNEFGFEKKGLLMLCKSEQVLEGEAHLAEYAQKLGLHAEIYDAKQTTEKEPNIRMDVAGSVFFADDAHLTPGVFIELMRRRVTSLGVECLWGTEVLGWKTRDGAIDAAVTSRGELSADEFVLCGGSWSSQMVKSLGLKLPMQAGKGYSLTLPAAPQTPSIPAILTEARVAVTPMLCGLRFAGTMEIAGMDPGINPARVRGIIKSVPNFYPEFNPDHFKDASVWSGFRPCSPDGLPYVGRTSAYSNLSLAAGHAMLGLSLGPITGKLVSQVISDERTSIDISLLNPGRYSNVRARNHGRTPHEPVETRTVPA